MRPHVPSGNSCVFTTGNLSSVTLNKQGKTKLSIFTLSPMIGFRRRAYCAARQKPAELSPLLFFAAHSIMHSVALLFLENCVEDDFDNAQLFAQKDQSHVFLIYLVPSFNPQLRKQL
jgi:hypothetical protein